MVFKKVLVSLCMFNGCPAPPMPRNHRFHPAHTLTIFEAWLVLDQCDCTSSLARCADLGQAISQSRPFFSRLRRLLARRLVVVLAISNATVAADFCRRSGYNPRGFDPRRKEDWS